MPYEINFAKKKLDPTKSALNDPSTGGNPVEMTYDNTRRLFEDLM